MWVHLQRVGNTRQSRGEALDVAQRLLEVGALLPGSEAANAAFDSIFEERAIFFDAANGHFGLQPLLAPNWRYHGSWIAISAPILSQPDAHLGAICPMLPAPAIEMMQHYGVHGIFDGFEVKVPKEQTHMRTVYRTFGFTELRGVENGFVTLRLPISRIHILARKFLPFVGAQNTRSKGHKGFSIVDSSRAGFLYSPLFGKNLVLPLAEDGSAHFGIAPDFSAKSTGSEFCPG
jgi:hypothetical protein